MGHKQDCFSFCNTSIKQQTKGRQWIMSNKSNYEQELWWRNKKHWIKRDISQTTKQFYEEMEKRGFERITNVGFRYGRVLLVLCDTPDWNDGIMLFGIHSNEEGGMRKTMKALGEIADHLKCSVGAYCQPFTIKPSDSTIENLGLDIACEEVFVSGRYEEKQEQGRLNRRAIYEALLRYGFEPAVPPEALQGDKELEKWFLIREPTTA